VTSPTEKSHETKWSGSHLGVLNGFVFAALLLRANLLFHRQLTWIMNQQFLGYLDCEKFNAQNERFINQSGDLSIILEIYQSN